MVSHDERFLADLGLDRRLLLTGGALSPAPGSSAGLRT
ncbi:unannotated protein [freshwater metagenome]|uniref:Unannotated protein n=1 Tax=freshwater metagenome TaxID=449393 RepID=A0A6J7I481_9ZZZZ